MLTEEGEKLLWGWATGGSVANIQDVRRSVVSALDEVRRLRGEAPPRIEVDHPDVAASVEPMALLCVEPEETMPYWKGRAQALEDEVRRLVDLARYLADD